MWYVMINPIHSRMISRRTWCSNVWIRLLSGSIEFERKRKTSKSRCPFVPLRMDTKPMEWSKLVIALMKELIAIISDRFEIGVEWNASGCDFSAYKPASTPTPISAPSTAPPPAVPAVPAHPSNFAAELESLVGANGVKNLRHVEKSEMTSKNPSLRGNVKMEEKKTT